MKASSEKSSSTTSTTTNKTTSQPFFAKAGGGSFFAPEATAPAVQTKMEVNKPGDKFEQEADEMANKVMRMPEPEREEERELPQAGSQEIHVAAFVQRQEEPAKDCAKVTSIPIQAKLTVGAPNDEYEREADKVAEQVMTKPEPMPAQGVSREEEEKKHIQAKPLSPQIITPLVQRRQEELQRLPLESAPSILQRHERRKEEEKKPLQKTIHQPQKSEEEDESPLIQRLCDGCGDELQRQPKEEEAPLQIFLQRKPTSREEEERLQTKLDNGNKTSLSPNVEQAISGMEVSGEPLPDETRAFFESRFDRDFSQVRLHADAGANSLAGQLKAQAFTHGQHVFLGSGKYAPETGEGKRLLAHELTHVVQQRGHEYVEQYGEKLSKVSKAEHGNMLAPKGGVSPQKNQDKANGVLQFKGIDETLSEDVEKGLWGSFHLYFTEDFNKAKKQPELNGYIRFDPSLDSRVPHAEKIGLVQIVKVVDDATGKVNDVTKTYPKLKMPKDIMTEKKPNQGIEEGFYVDMPYDLLTNPPSKFAIESKLPRTLSYTEKGDAFVEQHGYKKGDTKDKVQSAFYVDTPGWNNISTFLFETYAQTDSKTYGGVSWGFKIVRNPFFTRLLEIKPGSIKTDLEIEPTPVMPIYSLSPTAADAIKRFEKVAPPLVQKKAENVARTARAETPLLIQEAISGNVNTHVQTKIKIGGEAYKPKEGDKFGVMVATGFSDTAVKIFEDMLANPSTFVFDDFQKLIYELKMRKNIMENVTVANSALEPGRRCCGMPTEQYPGGRLNTRYWNQEGSFFFIAKKKSQGGGTPSEAIKSIFLPNAGSILECLSMAKAILYLSLLNTVGEEKFDAMFPDGRGLIILASSQGREIETTVAVVSGSIPENPDKYRELKVNSSHELIPGDWVYFSNLPDYKVKPGSTGFWTGENAFVTGKDRYQGFGVPTEMTEQGLNRLLATEYKKETGDIREIEVLVEELRRQKAGLQLDRVKRPIANTLFDIPSENLSEEQK